MHIDLKYDKHGNVRALALLDAGVECGLAVRETNPPNAGKWSAIVDGTVLPLMTMAELQDYRRQGPRSWTIAQLILAEQVLTSAILREFLIEAWPTATTKDVGCMVDAYTRSDWNLLTWLSSMSLSQCQLFDGLIALCLRRAADAGVQVIDPVSTRRTRVRPTSST